MTGGGPLRFPLAAALAVVLAQCGSTPPSSLEAGAFTPPTGARALLFIGNSLTAQNDLPRRVGDLAADAGLGVAAVGLVGSGFSIGDHMVNGQAQTAIRSRRWELVVLQQGPSTLPESRATLIADATAITRVIREVGSEPALLAVWPLPGQQQADVTASYRAAAEAVHGRLFRAGDAWQAALARDASFVFTVEDGFHPSPLGSHLAALVVHCALYGSLPATTLAQERVRAGRANLTDAQVAILREAACSVR